MAIRHLLEKLLDLSDPLSQPIHNFILLDMTLQQGGRDTVVIDMGKEA